MKLVNKVTLCPVCGFDLGFKPWDGKSPSHETCPCCGIEFGYDDVPEASGCRGTREEIYNLRRSTWIRNGMKWQVSEWPKPSAWDPSKQLESIGIKKPSDSHHKRG